MVEFSQVFRDDECIFTEFHRIPLVRHLLRMYGEIDREEEMADQLQSSFYADVGGLHE